MVTPGTWMMTLSLFENVLRISAKKALANLRLNGYIFALAITST